MEKISVIIPVYNVEKYLVKCIDSVINQTYTNLEIILVDDGSPDRCPQICDEYAKKDKRIRVIHKANGGLSDARNAGIDVADGEYICFLDGDDYIAPNMYEKLYTAIKKNNADMSICNFCYVDENGNILDKENMEYPIKDEYISGRKVLEEKLMELNRHYWVVAWNKLYRHEIFERCRYPVGKIHEDEYVLPMIYDGKNVEGISDRLIYYVQRPGSIMHEKSPEKTKNSIEALINLSRFYIENKYDDRIVYKALTIINIYMSNSYTYLKNIKKDNSYNIKAYRQLLKKCIINDGDILHKLSLVLSYIDPYGRVFLNILYKLRSILNLKVNKK